MISLERIFQSEDSTECQQALHCDAMVTSPGGGEGAGDSWGVTPILKMKLWFGSRGSCVSCNKEMIFIFVTKAGGMTWEELRAGNRLREGSRGRNWLG